MNDHSYNSLIAFLDYAIEKGLHPKKTMDAAKHTSTLVFGNILSDEEKKDIRQIDVDTVFQQFRNKGISNLSPDSLRTYRGRLNSALREFFDYMNDPFHYKPKGRAKTSVKAKTRVKAGKPAQQNLLTEAVVALPPKDGTAYQPQTFDLPVPIRDGKHMVTISNIPKDIQEEDVKRIAAVIRAYSNE